MDTDSDDDDNVVADDLKEADTSSSESKGADSDSESQSQQGEKFLPRPERKRQAPIPVKREPSEGDEFQKTVDLTNGIKTRKHRHSTCRKVESRDLRTELRIVRRYLRRRFSGSFANQVFSINGLFLQPRIEQEYQRKSKPPRAPRGISAFVPSAKQKAIRFCVSSDVANVSDSKIFEEFQSCLSAWTDSRTHFQAESKTHLERTYLVSSDGLLRFELIPSTGDEIALGSHAQDIQWIGNRFVGTVMVSGHIPPETVSGATKLCDPEDAEGFCHREQTTLTYPSWHSSLPRPKVG